MHPLRNIRVVLVLLLCSCSTKNDRLQSEVKSLSLPQGEITLCGSGEDQFGAVNFELACSPDVREDFALALALLHSFEYTEAEKAFARVIRSDPECVMGYWGVAMCYFHPLWAPPSVTDLEKGSRVIALARAVNSDSTSRESYYLETIATIYDQWNTTDYRQRLLKFKSASQVLYEKFSDDEEAAIFYALALGATADPADKSFRSQKAAGEFLNRLFTSKPNHPGVAHYLIHNYDHPELATYGLDAARKYARIAAASAHAQHMPSHIFTRLGLWDESIQSNINSIAAAKCYAEQSNMDGHWDEELHGLDYLMYAYLQKGRDDEALQQLEYLRSIKKVSPVSFKDAYSFAAIPARYAVERKDWPMAAKLELIPADFPWNKFPWERANINFARFLGLFHTGEIENARRELMTLDSLQRFLASAGEAYKANLVAIQVTACSAWLMLEAGNPREGVRLMREAASMEEATAKHPVTPGEIVPARELLADMFMKIGDFPNAKKEYLADLERHPNKYNDIYGASMSARKMGDTKGAEEYLKSLEAVIHRPAKKDR